MTAARNLASTVALDPVTAMLSAVASRATAQFTDRNLTVRRSRIVHAVEPTPWLAGVELPGPACHVGVAGWALEDLHPTTEPVTCRRCLRHQGHRVTPHLRLANQLVLPLQDEGGLIA
ncbi:hypothetical protein JOF53_006563 [Crossiella equi]|uniref:Uncharacterized protein n=1 Tax=Crossiella equi TaxID=130796 RepID=A0ABS5AMA3_9PSEU|nr:hypothetical protein [Crossiella equi]MBP2477691.1 hypothetical protein [Crossiella equi]